jgi:macrolide transport system ATP-binding/permease protein
MLRASDLRTAHGGVTIFDGLSLTLSGGRRTGLVGPNGAGKTTLLRLLAGVTGPERGSVTLGPGDRIGYLPQEPPGPELTIDRLLGAALGDVWRLRDELARLEARLGDPAALAAYGDAQERYGALGGWALQAQLDTARAALGIAHIPLDAPLGGLSGGEAARALLAGVLLARPTVLLLDEPTNHLDLDGLAWLEEFLVGFPGEVLVVSHDRRFLDDTVSQILELDGGTLIAYEGGYTAYRNAKARAAARVELAYEAQEKRHRRLKADITATRGHAQHTENTVSRAEAPRMKRYAKKVAKKAQARERRLVRELESDEHIEKPRHVGPLKVELEGSAGGRLVAALRDVSAGWDGTPLLRGVDLVIHGRDRIAVTGANGAGKSTLLAARGHAGAAGGRRRAAGRGRRAAAGPRRAAGRRAGRGVRARARRRRRGRGSAAARALRPGGRGGAAAARPAEPGRARPHGDRRDGGREGQAPAPRRAHEPPRLPVARRAGVRPARVPGRDRRRLPRPRVPRRHRRRPPPYRM